jgi:HEAT repeat protein
MVLTPLQAGPPPWAFDEIIDSVMYKSPELLMPRMDRDFPQGAIELWCKALARPEGDLRRAAAESIVRARSRRAQGLEAAIEPLRQALEREDQPPSVCLAVAQALVALDARDAAPSLLRLAQSGSNEARQLIEPALARWDYRPARPMWLDRLADPGISVANLLLAIRGLAAVGEMRAAPRLSELALSGQTQGSVRLEAARGLGVLRVDGLEKEAEVLAADTTPRGLVARLAAASLLQRHTSVPAVKLLQHLASDPEPAVAAVAVARLLDIDPKLVAPVLKDVLGSADPQVRMLGVKVLFQLPTPEHLHLLGDRLADEHIEVRRQARDCLHKVSHKQEMRNDVIDNGFRLLNGSSWRGQEQAAILLVQLDQKKAADELLELLESRRPEVFVTAAWGLRKLAVEKTLKPVTAYVEAGWKRFQDRTLPEAERLLFPLRGHQLSQLNQLLGQERYKPSDDPLRLYIAKFSADAESRAAAIWALGLIHDGKNDSKLTALLLDRLNDVKGPPQEEPRVRQMCAITLARMGAKEALPDLQNYCKDLTPARDPVQNSLAWAIAKLTGAVVPAPKNSRANQLGWFLIPVP